MDSNQCVDSVRVAHSIRKTLALLFVVLFGTSLAHAESKEAAVLKFVSEKLNQDNEVWEYQSKPPKTIIDIDSDNVREFRSYLIKNNPELMRSILESEAKAKYMTVLVFKNKAGTLYKVVHYLERDNGPCKNMHEIEFRNYNLMSGAPGTTNIVSGTLADGGDCPAIH